MTTVVREHLLDLARLLGDGWMALLGALPPALGLAASGLLMAVLFLLAQRWLTPRRRLRRLRDQLVASLHEVRLFADSPRLVLASQARALRCLAGYLAWSIPPLLLLSALFGPLFTQALLLWDWRPLAPGETALVTVEVASARALQEARVAPLPAALTLVPPVIRHRSSATLAFRVRALRPGDHRLGLELGGRIAEKTLQVGRRRAVSLGRVAATDWSRLLSREPPLAGERGLRRIAVAYPAEELRCLGLPWTVCLALFTVAAALALRRRLGGSG